jgi:hypothetical protein
MAAAGVVTDFRDVAVIDRDGNAIPRTWDALCETVRKYGWRRDNRAWWCPDCEKAMRQTPFRGAP